MAHRHVKVSAVSAMSLLGILAWWMGWTSPKSLIGDIDGVRPMSSLCKEYESLMLAKASEVQSQTATIRQLENELKSMDSENANLGRELTKSQEKIGFMVASIRGAQNGQVSVGSNVVLDRKDVERDIKTATQAYRRMEARKSNLAKNADRVRAQLKALGEYTDSGRNLLADMKGKLDSWKVSMKNNFTSPLDPNSIEGELLAAKDRANQIDAELSRRSVVPELATNTVDRNWDRWMSGSNEPDFWIAEAESIARFKPTSPSPSDRLSSNQ